MRDPVLGKNVTVRVYNSGWKLYACASSCSINISASTVETSTTGSGVWGSFTPQKLGWSGSLDGVVNFDGQITLFGLIALQVSMTVIPFQFEWVDDVGNSYSLTGDAIITSASATGQMDDVATFSIELQGTGALIQLLDPGDIFDDSFDDTFN